MSIDINGKTIKEIFPEINNFRISVSMESLGVDADSSNPAYQYNENSHLVEKIPCDGSQCTGCVPLGNLIRGMISDKKQAFDDGFLCGGSWNSPGEQLAHERHCDRWITVKATAEYK